MFLRFANESFYSFIYFHLHSYFKDLEWPSDDEEGLNDEIYAQSQTSSHGPSSDSQQPDMEMYPGKNDNPSRVRSDYHKK